MKENPMIVPVALSDRVKSPSVSSTGKEYTGLSL